MDKENMDNSQDESIVTLKEVLEAEQNMIEEANAVLGAGDDKNCTYSEGYMKRQPLYACLTCNPEAKVDAAKRAGVCLACCYHCHDGHDLVELYTKRNFRCDCGNSKFENFSCNLHKCKDKENDLNTYNQNFSGFYCTCSRPYPDPDDEVSDEMIQCIICEDWLHTRHLDRKIPTESYAEMVCKNCVDKHQFLLHYDNLCVLSHNTVENDAVVDIETSTENGSESKNEDEQNTVVTPDDQNAKENLINTGEKEENELKDKDKVINNSKDEEKNTDEEKNIEKCIKPSTKSEEICAKFWANISWREQLCKCEDCLNIYKNENVMFLIDSGDTVQFYEEKGKLKSLESAKQVEEDGLKFLNSVDRIPLLETLAGYNDLKSHLADYLKKFAENKKVVREEDIREFFSNFEARKKQKVEIPFTCR